MTILNRLEISGTPRERGIAYGRGLAGLIRERDAAWRHAIEARDHMPADAFIARLLGATDFLPAIERFVPDLLEEVHGIAEGAGLPFDAMLAAQLMDEEWWFSSAIAPEHQHEHHAHCSTLGSLDRAGGRAVVAQNMDLIGWMDGFQVALTIRDEATGLDQIVLTVAGMIGLCGLNSAGLGLGVNTLADLNVSRTGLPVAFLARGLLARRSHAEAVAFLASAPHASGQSYILADRGEISCHEGSAAGVARYQPANGPADTVWHTNHALASTDWHLTADGHHVEAAVALGENSRCRMEALDRRLAAAQRPLDVATAATVLADRSDGRHPVSRRASGHAAAGFTFASVIWELDETPSAHMAPGAPCTRAYEPVALPAATAHRRAAE
ncbi:MAG: C45 family peptidase [Hyphomicrobiaceae bacterium]